MGSKVVGIAIEKKGSLSLGVFFVKIVQHCSVFGGLKLPVSSKVFEQQEMSMTSAR